MCAHSYANSFREFRELLRSACRSQILGKEFLFSSFLIQVLSQHVPRPLQHLVTQQAPQLSGLAFGVAGHCVASLGDLLSQK